LRRERRATLCVEWQGDGLSEHAIRGRLEAAGLRISGTRLTSFSSGAQRALEFEILEFSLLYDSATPIVCQTIAGEEAPIMPRI
jgi:hypothetical protein